MCSASSTACWIERTVSSMWTTTPFFRPVEGWVPTPITSMPSSVTSPTIAAILVVPMSSPTTSSSRFAIAPLTFRLRATRQLDGDAIRARPLVEIDEPRALARARERRPHGVEAREARGQRLVDAADAHAHAARDRVQRVAEDQIVVRLAGGGTRGRAPRAHQRQRVTHLRARPLWLGEVAV